MTENPSVTVHIAYAYADVPRDFRNRITKLTRELQNRGYEVRERAGFEDGTASDLYICEDECDLLVAICDRGSTGLGIQIGRRFAEKKPLLLVAFLATRTARLIVDAEYEGSCVETAHASSVGELVKIVIEYLDQLGSKLPEVSKSESEGTHAVA